MAHVIYCDPEKDKEVRKLFRSLSPELSKPKWSSKKFKKQVYPKFNSFLKKKQRKQLKAIAKKEEALQNSIKQYKYTKMHKKQVKCHNPQPFLKRNEENIRKLRERQAKQEKEKVAMEEMSVNSCSFHPTIHNKSRKIAARSIKDWYVWDKKKEKKRLERLQRQNQLEMSNCVGRFRSPQKRKVKNKSVHLSQRYLNLWLK